MRTLAILMVFANLKANESLVKFLPEFFIFK